MEFSELLLGYGLTDNILSDLEASGLASVAGLDDSRLIYFIGNIVSEIEDNILIIAHDNYHMMKYYEDLVRLVDEDRILIYPELEILPHEQLVADMHELGERLSVLEQIVFKPKESRIVLVTIDTLMKKMMPINRFLEHSLTIKVGNEVDLKDISRKLTVLGYERVNMVEDQGQYSIRGGILDIFTISASKPYRIELFGDEIDSIRQFDTVTQRSSINLNDIIISPAREIILLSEQIYNAIPEIKEDFLSAVDKLIALGHKEEARYLEEKMKESLEKLQELHEFPGYEQFLPYFYKKLDTFMDYLPDNTILLFDQTDKIWHKIGKFEQEIADTQATLLEQGSVIPSYIENFHTANGILEQIENFRRLYFYSRYVETPFYKTENIFNLKTRGVEPFHGKVELLADRLAELVKEKYRVVLTLNSTSKARRISGFLEEKNLPVFFKEGNYNRGEIIVKAGSLAEGFVFEDINLFVLTEKEVFGKKQKRKRQIQEFEDGVKISSINELNVGDYVVHENHGIGKYLGVKTMEIQDQHLDYLVIKYAGEDKLYVPTDQVNLVQKYIGADQSPPRLYKLGGSEWKKVKQKVENSVKEMAIGLLELYAERETVKGYAFSEDTVWQQEFEEAFPYEETIDQLKAIKDVKQDMEDDSPMDRLLCGDVGYGKTEVAIRAAFKAVMEGKQAAILVPTTILAQQHFNTFRERMENYPINIEMLSRFRTATEQKNVLKRLAVGKVDIIIGTHRLLSSDIIFDDLGLLIVDEEQRFGVTHKEKLKEFKRNVDVLTMTATPIPRTLHMALVGVRDMSVIETPPENRYPIRTYIREFNSELIRDAIRKELSRNGQVYFVHNRVEDIEEKADRIRKLVPDCRIAIAHGQMNEHKLEKIMLKFYHQEYDVLVCTTIIETGLDLPSVNTIIINKAEQMGLAQLYQLRGRVGRSNRIAYAYLMYEKDRILPEIAEKRLKAIKEFTNLGSGFKIAMRDLEIRGAGNLLGPEQHGHIASVGFSLYCKLLDSAVKEIKGKERDEDREVEVKFNIDAYIPENYISDSQQKIEIYKKITKVKKEEGFIDVIDELIDRFGEPPEEVMNLIRISKIKIKAGYLGMEKIIQKKGVFNCIYSSQNKVDGRVIMELLDKYQRRIKVRIGNKPVIGIRAEGLDDFQEVITNYYQLSTNQ
ncbi:MAG: transcription-repair coupling factor [Halanaerobiales bacterium]